jgi:hypothetical protein
MEESSSQNGTKEPTTESEKNPSESGMEIKDPVRLIASMFSLLLGILLIWLQTKDWLGVINHKLIFFAVGCAFIGFFFPAFGGSVQKREGQEGLFFLRHYIIMYWSKIIVYTILFYALVSLPPQEKEGLFKLIVGAGSVIIGMQVDSIQNSLNKLISHQ